MIDITNMIEPESNPAALESERAMNANLTGEVERLQARVAELYDLIKYAQVESGVCMCGYNMQDHNQASGHSPVDVWDHAVEQVVKEGSSEAFILRKQAEAVNEFGNVFDRVHRMISSRKVAEDAYEYSNNLINEAENAVWANNA